MTAPAFDGTQPCAQVDPELFFPNKGHAKVAKRICDSCHFFDDCREYAIHYDVDGIWSGTTRRDRRQIRKERGITVIPMVYEPEPERAAA